MDWVYYSLLLILSIAGVVLTVLTLPGTWLMLLVYVCYAVVTKGAYVGGKSIFAIFLLATIAEIIDTFASGAGAKKAGASRRAMIGAVIGGLLGAIFSTFLIPIPVVGTIIGACLGCFLGAGIVELMVRQELGQSVKVGYHAAKGRLIGIVVKVLFSILMMAMIAWIALPFRPKVPLPTPPLLPTTTTSPTTR